MKSLCLHWNYLLILCWSNIWTCRLLTGPEKFKLFEAIDKLTIVAIEQYETRAKQWGRDFLSVYHSHHVTPYIHAMMYDVGEFMRIHGSIIPFMQQGLEKHNDIMTKMYFRASSHRGVEALRQIVEKRNRIE